MSSSSQRAQLLLPVRNRAAFLDAYFSRGQRPGSQEGAPLGSDGSPITPAFVTPSSATPSLSRLGQELKAAGDESGGMFVPGEIDVTLGEVVDVELFFHEEQVRFHIRAQVKWKRTQVGRRALPPGVGIEFLSSEHRTQQQILRFAEGKESVSHVDRSRRWALHVEVLVHDDASDASIAGVTDDISEGGCFVVSEALLDPGARVVVKLKSPGSLFGWLTLDGLVTWRRVEPDRTGFGVELKFASERQRLKMKKIVDVVRERTLREVRIKVPRLPSTPPTSA